MSLNAATIEVLIAKGLSAADLLEVARATEVKADPTNAARQARHRAKRKSNAVTVTDAPPYEDTSIPRSPPVEPSGSTAPKGRERGAKISEDWTPPPIAELSPEARRLASQWPAAAYRAEAEAFRNYWIGETGKTARKSNWKTAWANWIVRISGRVMRDSARPRDGPASDLDALMASVERKYGQKQELTPIGGTA
jgi:hypothetical protein